MTYALAYGSFTQGTADRFSDLEYWLFVRPETLAAFDVSGWLEAITPVHHLLVNEFGTPTAILPGLLRVEVHVASHDELAGVAAWPGEHVRPQRMLVKDQDGALAAILQTLSGKQLNPTAEAQQILDRTLNWLAFGLNVLARGEQVRALELLWWVRGGVLRLACLEAGQTEYWLSPARLAEQRLPPELLARYAHLTGELDKLEQAYAEAVRWTIELAGQLGLELNSELTAGLRGRIRTVPR
ncbi:hypothetical protein ACFSC4_16890 [Deinococcus malanensis]|uniref:hypothetical protein n=1 Tax=Deinococcus malanensis TaxID=1706855 RepID=UPI001664FF32|nr:hypothetical protein [Deinococcus malanensis]